MPEGAVDPVTAVDILRGFNAPSGVAHAMADQVATAAVALAADLGRPALVALFADAGPAGIAALRGRPATGLVPWPGAGALTTWVEAVRIVLVESVVHLLDVLDALGRTPDVPPTACARRRTCSPSSPIRWRSSRRRRAGPRPRRCPSCAEGQHLAPAADRR